MVCPVAGLEIYVKEAQSIGIDLPTGYPFRPLDHSSRYVFGYTCHYPCYAQSS